MYTIFCLSKEKDKHYFVELNFGKSCQFTSTTTTKWLLCWNLSVLLSAEQAEKKIIPLVSVAEELSQKNSTIKGTKFERNS